MKALAYNGELKEHAYIFFHNLEETHPYKDQHNFIALIESFGVF